MAEGSSQRAARLPDFLVIGALKAGTTYIDRLLRYHPELCLPTLKETDFFGRNYDRGPGWYERWFADCGDRLAGEVSPEYLGHPGAPARIRALLPDARLLASLRDPVRRAHSDYKHYVQRHGFAGDFEQFLRDYPDAIEKGRYFALLSRYLELFPREQLHLVVFEDLVRDPRAAMRDVFAFLGVADSRVPRELEPVNVSVRPRFHRSYLRARAVSQWLHRRPGGEKVVAWAKRLGAPRLFGEAEGEHFAPLSPDAVGRLAEIYADDVASLSRLIDRDLGAVWPSMTAAGDDRFEAPSYGPT